MSVQILWSVSGAGISLVIVFDEMLEARRSPHLIRVNSNQILQGATTLIPKLSTNGSQSDIQHLRPSRERRETPTSPPASTPKRQINAARSSIFDNILVERDQICERGGLHLCPWRSRALDDVTAHGYGSVTLGEL